MLEKKTISQCISVDCCKGWNDAINEIPKWINVKEGLPNHSGDYLVITRASNRVRVLSYSAVHKVFNAFDSQLEVNLLPIPVTHWMPLPGQPKEE